LLALIASCSESRTADDVDIFHKASTVATVLRVRDVAAAVRGIATSSGASQST
jgi:hypothetical protein